MWSPLNMANYGWCTTHEQIQPSVPDSWIFHRCISLKLGAFLYLQLIDGAIRLPLVLPLSKVRYIV